MFEKFSIADIDSAGRGGEYTVQAGFGWTNGVVLTRGRVRPSSCRTGVPRPARRRCECHQWEWEWDEYQYDWIERGGGCEGRECAGGGGACGGDSDGGVAAVIVTVGWTVMIFGHARPADDGRNDADVSCLYF